MKKTFLAYAILLRDLFMAKLLAGLHYTVILRIPDSAIRLLFPSFYFITRPFNPALQQLPCPFKERCGTTRS